MTANQSNNARWSGRSVAVAVAGGIACYKAASLVSLLTQAGADVRVVMTRAATRFVSPLTFRSLSGSAVMTSPWRSEQNPESPHVAMARWCELMIIAPATADMIAKIAAGVADDPVCLLALVVGRSKPVLLAPAMNADMWDNPITQRNVQTVRDLLGYHTVGPETGWQACRTTGPGRMSEPEQILAVAEAHLSEAG